MRKYMNIKKIAGISAIVLVSLMLLLVGGMVIWSITGTYPAGETAIKALESDALVSVSTDRWIEFRNQSKDSKTGIIFYPGGLVEPEAYAPVLRTLAEEGYFIVITPMPLNLAIFNSNEANKVMQAYPEIDRWVVAGHSLGGATAGIYAAANLDKIDGVFFWDSYPPQGSDLSESSIPALSIFGTRNSFPNTDNFDSQRPLHPANTRFVPIEGASHAQFGDYGPQAGDVEPQMSMEAQHRKVEEIVLAFLREEID
jgi:hypothetical protein